MKNREKFDGIYVANLVGLSRAVGQRTANRTRRSGESVQGSRKTTSKYKSESRGIPSSLHIMSKGSGGTTYGQGAIVKGLSIPFDRQQIMDSLVEGIIIFDKDGRIGFVNQAAERIIGFSRGYLLGKSCSEHAWNIYHMNGQRVREEELQLNQVLTSQRVLQDVELRFELLPAKSICLSINGAPFNDEQGQVIGVIISFMDITERHRLEKELREHRDNLETVVKQHTLELKYTNTLLEMFARNSSRKEYLDAVAQLISEIAGCACVGIRVVHEDDVVPFVATIGFAADFCEKEDTVFLNQNDCVCTQVMNQTLDFFDLASLTTAGSFFSGDISKFTEGLGSLECSQLHRICTEKGFTTLAVIPICYHDRVVGAIHLADQRPHTEMRSTVNFLETIAPLVGAAIHRFNLEEELRRNYDIQKTINAILNLPLDELTLSEIMQQIFQLVVAIPWFDLDDKGCLYLAENPEVILDDDQKGQVNPLALLNSDCQRIVLGRCNGGSGGAIGAEQVPECTDVALCLAKTDYRPHHHYCVPISLGSKILGVMNFFLKDEHCRCRGELELLTTIADTIAGIITRKRTNEQLRFSEERFAKSFHASPVPMFIATAAEYQLIEVNSSFLSVTGYGDTEVLGESLFDLALILKTENAAGLREQLEIQGVMDNEELKLVNRSGESREGLLCIENISLGSELCLLGVFKDVTQHKELEREMARLEWLNLVGEMAAGIGHEVRNPMTTARGFLQMLGNKEECLQYKEYFDLIIEELDRANLIISEFLSMAQNKEMNLKLWSLNDIIQALMPLMQADAYVSDKSIQVELGQVTNLIIDEKEIRQLILNLVRNGLEAMLPGGNLQISTFEEIGEVVLAVRDEGQGIDPKMLEVLGTPFVTSKEAGTGLGLSVCYNIAARHRAIITIETSNQGTTFFVRFPVNGQAAVH